MAEIARPTTDFRRLADFIWDIANLLRGDYKQADYGKVILPMASSFIALQDSLRTGVDVTRAPRTSQIRSPLRATRLALNIPTLSKYGR